MSDFELIQTTTDLELMLSQSQKDEIDENILIEATAKLAILTANKLLEFMENSE